MIHRVLDLGPDLRARDHGAAQRHRLDCRGCHARRGAAHHDPAAAFAAAGLRGEPEKIIGILHYKDLLPVWEERRRAIRTGRPSRAFRIRRLLRPAPGGARNQAALPDAGRVSRRAARTWPWWWTSSAPLSACSPWKTCWSNWWAASKTSTTRRARAPTVRNRRSGTGRQPRASATWKANSASRFRPTPVSRLWPDFCSSSSARFPHAGESVEYAGRRYTVLEMERNRIARVKIEKVVPVALPPVVPSAPPPIE